MFKRFMIVTAVAATMFASVAGSSFAGTDDEVVTSTGLDLRSQQGRAAFMTRIEHAARHVCGPPELRNSDWYDADQYCMKATVAAAKAQADQIFARLDGSAVTVAANASAR